MAWEGKKNQSGRVFEANCSPPVPIWKWPTCMCPLPDVFIYSFIFTLASEWLNWWDKPECDKTWHPPPTPSPHPTLFFPFFLTFRLVFDQTVWPHGFVSPLPTYILLDLLTLHAFFFLFFLHDLALTLSSVSVGMCRVTLFGMTRLILKSWRHATPSSSSRRTTLTATSFPTRTKRMRWGEEGWTRGVKRKCSPFFATYLEDVSFQKFHPLTLVLKSWMEW